MNAEASEANAVPRGQRGRSLRVKVGLLVGGALIVLFALFTALSTLLTGGFFSGLQDDFTVGKINRVVAAMDQLGVAKSRLTQDNAEWDETFNFIKGTDAEYLARYYAPGMNSVGQDVVLVFNSERKLVGAAQTRQVVASFIAPAGLDVESLAKSRLLAEKGRAGLALDGGEVLLLAAWPVRPSNHEGPSNGWLVFGTYLSPVGIQKLAETTGVKLSIRVVSQPTPEPALRTLSLSRPFDGGSTAYFTPARVWHGGKGVPDTSVIVPALTGDAWVSLMIGTELLVYQQALRARNWILAISVLFGIIFVFVSLAAVERSVLKPLAALDHEMDAMSQTEGEVGKLQVGRDDEIGRLAKSANRLLDRVQAGQRAAQEQGELLSSVLDSIAEAVVALRCVRNSEGEVEDLRVVLINHPGEKMLRVEEGELNGKTIRVTYPKLVEAGIYDRWKMVAVTQEILSFESYYEGHKICGWYRNLVAPWGDGVVVTVTDISEEKKRAQDLAESLAELERFNTAMIGREERILEMKREVNALRVKLGQPEIYQIDVTES